MWCWIIGRPATGKSGLGMSNERGRNLVPVMKWNIIWWPYTVKHPLMKLLMWLFSLNMLEVAMRNTLNENSSIIFPQSLNCQLLYFWYHYDTLSVVKTADVFYYLFKYETLTSNFQQSLLENISSTFERTTHEYDSFKHCQITVLIY